MKYDQEVYEALAENERTKLTEEVLRIGDILGLKTTSSDYNAFKVMEVIKQLIDASRLASKPMKKRPLAFEDIKEMFEKHANKTPFVLHTLGSFCEFARAIERAHGIGQIDNV